MNNKDTVIQAKGEIKIFVNEDKGITIQQEDFMGEDSIVYFGPEDVDKIVAKLQELKQTLLEQQELQRKHHVGIRMLSKQKITKRFVDALPFPDTGQKIYQDGELRGFAVRVTPTKKAFIINRKFKGELVRHKFAEYPAITVEQARVKAGEIIAELTSGTKPKDKLVQQKMEAITLGQAFEDYIETKDLKPKTKKD